MINNSLRFQKITFTILSPFDTYIFLDIDKLKFANFEIEREKVIKTLNEKNIEIGNKTLRIEWIKESIDQYMHSGSGAPLLISEDEDFQLSFIMGKLGQHSIKDIEEKFKKDFKDESLNTIVLLFTMMNLIEIFGTIFSILSTDLILSSIIQIIILITGTMSIGLMINLYFKLSRK